MISEKEVTNECLLVNYVAGYDADCAMLIVNYSCDNGTKGDTCTFYGDTATTLYSKLLRLVGIVKEEN